MKPYFFGKYYKFVSPDGFSFAVIDSFSDEGKALQIITPDGGFDIADPDCAKCGDGQFEIDLHGDKLEMSGRIKLGKLTPLRYNAMGPFKPFSMECSHDIYSMHHGLSGNITVNGQNHSFSGGFGYIEGDKGRSFPEKYVWYNSVGADYGLTVAVATIPLGKLRFTGLLCFISYKGTEYRLATYNFAKVVRLTKDEIIISRGGYRLRIRMADHGGHELKAPHNGKMGRLIKENISVESQFCFSRNGEVILERTDKHSSFEYMFD